MVIFWVTMQVPVNPIIAAGTSILICLLMAGCPEDSEISSDLAITAPPQIDPLTPVIDQTVLLAAVVRNLDGNYASVSQVAVRIDGVEVARLNVDAIAPRETRTVTTSLRFSTAGTHSVALIADPDQRLNDSDRSNNTFILTVTVAVPVNG